MYTEIGKFTVDEHYKGHIIIVTVAGPDKKFKWIPSCRVLDESSRKFLKELDWYLNYDTREQAEKVGLLVGKKWVDQLDAKFR
ncbi:MAG: hypothetical protein ACREQP_21970 [Candidatus Binatia bacterium]